MATTPVSNVNSVNPNILVATTNTIDTTISLMPFKTGTRKRPLDINDDSSSQEKDYFDERVKLASLSLRALLSLFSLAYAAFMTAKATPVEPSTSTCLTDLLSWFESKETTEEAEVARKISCGFLLVIFARSYGVQRNKMKAVYYAEYANTINWFEQLEFEVSSSIRFTTIEKARPELRKIGGHLNYILAVVYQDGIGRTTNPTRTCEHLQKSVDYSNHVDALLNLGWCYSVGFGTSIDNDKAFQYYLKSANEGLSQSQFNVGLCFHVGKGTPINYNRAAQWFRKSADQGLAKAQHNLATYLWTGLGVRQDKKEALQLFKKAAEQEHVESMRRVGFFYDNGIEMTQDKLMAMKWYRKAAEMGDEKSQEILDDYIEKETINNPLYERSMLATIPCCQVGVCHSRSMLSFDCKV